MIFKIGNLQKLVESLSCILNLSYLNQHGGEEQCRQEIVRATLEANRISNRPYAIGGWPTSSSSGTPRCSNFTKTLSCLSFDISIALFQKLSVLDRLLTPAILVCMVVGVVIGVFVPGVQQAFDTVKFYGVSVRKHLYSARYGSCS
jgi:hypothetical protein